jgi:hypothetical protein
VAQVAVVVIHLNKGDGCVKDEVLGINICFSNLERSNKFIVYGISIPQIMNCL